MGLSKPSLPSLYTLPPPTMGRGGASTAEPTWPIKIRVSGTKPFIPKLLVQGVGNFARGGGGGWRRGVLSTGLPGLLTPEAEVLPRAGVSRAGFVSYRLPTDARQDDDKGDQCSQEDGDYNGQSCVHWEGWLGASVEGQGVSKSSHFVGGRAEVVTLQQ